MIEFIADHWQEFILYTSYVSMALYIILNISYYWLSLQSNKNRNYKFDQICSDFRQKDYKINHHPAFLFLLWLPRTIRLKVCSSDEAEDHLFRLS